MDDKYKAATIIISVLAMLEAIAIVTGTDGVYFAPVIAIIGAIAGVVFGFQLKMGEK